MVQIANNVCNLFRLFAQEQLVLVHHTILAYCPLQHRTSTFALQSLHAAAVASDN